MATVLELVRVHRILSERIERTLKQFDLTFARYEILMLLSFTRRGRHTVSGLGEQLQVHATSVSSALDLLEKEGLVVRLRCAEDRRFVFAQITPEGSRCATASTDAINEHVFAKLGLTPSQGIELWSLLRSFRANAGDFDVVLDRARSTG